MTDLSTSVKMHIAEGRRLVETLLEQRMVHFQSRTVETPDESGIYVFSDRRTHEILYVGRTEKGIKSRLKDHWNGYTSSDLAQRLVVEGIVKNKHQGREWIRDNVAVRWMTINELDTGIKWAEYFAIAVLRPKFNK